MYNGCGVCESTHAGGDTAAGEVCRLGVQGNWPRCSARQRHQQQTWQWQRKQLRQWSSTGSGRAAEAVPIAVVMQSRCTQRAATHLAAAGGQSPREPAHSTCSTVPDSTVQYRPARAPGRVHNKRELVCIRAWSRQLARRARLWRPRRQIPVRLPWCQYRLCRNSSGTARVLVYTLLHTRFRLTQTKEHGVALLELLASRTSS